MRVVLVSPLTLDAYSDPFLGEPIGMLYVAAAAEAAGHEVWVLDQVDPRYRAARNMVAEAVRLNPDVLGFTATTAAFPLALRIAEAVRARTDCRVVAGGIHVTHAPEAVLEHRAIDFAVLGEGEQTFVGLLAALVAGRAFTDVPGLAFRDERGRLARTPDRARLDDLDALPQPLRRGLPVAQRRIHGLLDVWPLGRRFVSVSTSRGCPYQCIFCAPPHPGQPRWTARSAASVLEEIDVLRTDGPVDFVLFTDPTFTHRAERVEEIASGLRRHHPALRWGCEVRAPDVTPRLAAVMAGAGCVFAGVGIESGTDAALERIRKHAVLADMRRALAALVDAEIQVHGNVIIGFPWEDRADLEACLEVYRTLPMDVFGINYAVPFPGTALHRQAVDEELIVDADLAHWTTRRPVMRTRHLSLDQLEEYYGRMSRSYYLRPGYGALVARRIRSRPRRVFSYALTALTGVAMGRFSKGWRRRSGRSPLVGL